MELALPCPHLTSTATTPHAHSAASYLAATPLLTVPLQYAVLAAPTVLHPPHGLAAAAIMLQQCYAVMARCMWYGRACPCCPSHH